MLFIYTGETVREVPAVVVDGANTALSRDFVRRVDASPDVKSRGADGKYGRGERVMRRTKAYGIIRIRMISAVRSTGQKAYVGLYCDMSGLLLLQSAADGVYGRVFGYEHRIADQTDGGIPLCGRMKCLLHLYGTRCGFVQSDERVCQFPDSGCVDVGHPTDAASGYRTDKRFCPQTGHVTQLVQGTAGRGTVRLVWAKLCVT